LLEKTRAKTVVALEREIERRKQVEEALRESEARLRALSEHTFEAIFISEKGVCTGQNLAAEKMFGYSNEEAVGRHGTDWIAPGYREIVSRDIVLNYASPYEAMALRKDGTTFPCEIQAKMIDDGRRIRVTSLRDITERKMAEEALRETEERYRDLVENIQDLICTHDLQGNLLFVNQASATVLGYSPADMVGTNLSSLLAHEVRDQFAAYLAAIQRDGQARGLMLVQTKSGERRIWEYRNTLRTEGPGAPIVRGFAHDITERKRAEQALRESEERYRVLVENLNEGIFVVKDGFLQFVNPRALEFTGYSADELTSGSFLQFVHPDDREMVTQRHMNRMAGDDNPYEYTLRIVTKDGSLKWLLVASRMIVWQGERAALVSATDMTARKEAEEALRDQFELQRALLSAIPASVYFKDTNSVYIMGNKRFSELSGVPESEIPGKDDYDLYTETDADAFRSDDAEIIATGKAKLNYEMKGTDAEGNAIWYSTSKAPFYDSSGQIAGLVGLCFDITDQKRTQELLLQSERFRAVADLAGGVAHNFNNLLQIVIGHLELALMDLELGNYSNVGGALEKVLESAKFGAETVRRLQSFAGIRDHSQVPQRGVFDVSDIVGQAVEMSKTWWKTIPEKQGIEVTLETDLQDGCLVRCEKNELFEVLVNLIKNASEALLQGGAIDVKTRVEGRHVVLKVRDTGVGISEENLKRLFNPFFTTKAQAGSGLGLASSRRIIEAFGGDILVESPVGKGTTFTILLPLAEQPSEQIEPTARVSCPGMTVLVIDDMQAVLDVLKVGLTRHGHVVVTATSGQQGLDIFRENPIDLVICDLGMPGINGWEVGKRIRSTCEERDISKTPFILLTGWGGQKTEAAKIAESGVDAVVEKPINISEILELIQEVGAESRDKFFNE